VQRAVLLLGLAALCGACDPADGAAPAALRAGTARVEITPTEFPTPYNLGIEELATQAADPLFARVLYLEDDDDRVLLLAVDWEGLLRSAHDMLRQAVAEATGLAVGNVVINASHSHNSMWINLDVEALLAPHGFHTIDTAYYERSVQAIAEAAQRAIASRRPARLSAGTGSLPELQANHREGYVKPEDRARFDAKRRYPVGVTDPTVGVVRIDPVEGGPAIAVLTSFAAHGTTSAGFGVISGDYPGAAMRRMEEVLGGETTALFLQGCGGNLSPGEGRPSGSPAAVEAAGGLLAARALAVLEAGLQPVASDGFAFGVRTVELPFVPLRGGDTVEILEERFRQAVEQYKQRRAAGLRGGYDGIIALGDRLTLTRNLEEWSRYDLQALRFGDDLVLAFLPGETFIEYALELRERIDAGTVIVSAYNDSTPVYIPDPVAFEEGGYEVGPWCYATPQTGRVMVEATLELVSNLAP
jgi:hypothetical protein